MKVFIQTVAILLLAAGSAFAEQSSPKGGALAPSAPPTSPVFTYSFARTLTEDEAAVLAGGDTRMRLNASRTRLRVQVIDNEYEARLGRIPPKETYEIDVHNKVVDTKNAPFIPTAQSAVQTSQLHGLTSQPSQFPQGNWSITAVRPREDRYGPYMISTNAVGKVNVYSDGGTEGAKIYVGALEDTGYSIHSNTKPFEVSKSYGCLVIRQEDAQKLAATLAKDRNENSSAVQKILVLDN